MVNDYLQSIQAAQSRVYDLAIESPVDEAPQLSGRLGNTVLLKREDLQPVFSFKLRGAYNKMAQMSAAQLKAGVVTASAGNHAQGVALAAKHLGITAVIYMPNTTPQIKVDGVRSRGGEAVLVGDTYDEAAAAAEAFAAEQGATYIPPYDDVDIIAGQGTVGLEILQQVPGRLDAVFVPVGGGGLLAGVLAYIKAQRPEVKVFGVEPDDAACLAAAMAAGERVVLDEVGIFADGVAVRQIGAEPFKVIEGLVDGVITASSDEMCAAIKDIFEDTRSIAEPAGALALAGLKKYVDEQGCEGQVLLAIDSGANTNFDRLRYISERTEIGEHREAILAVTIPERPGSFKQFCQCIGKRSVTEFNYRYADGGDAHVFVGVQTVAGSEDLAELIATLKSKGYPVEDMSHNEVAKLHIRHMVGGRVVTRDAKGVEGAAADELLYRFEFPERPGALLNFLSSLGERWNISMFHYRNHGAAFGWVLLGLQAGPHERADVEASLRTLNYRFSDESDNPAYRLFLK